MSSDSRKPTTVYAHNVSLPGALMPAIDRRIEELKSGNLSRYLTEMIAFDLRRLRAHSLTGRIARYPLNVQHAVDLAIDAHYVPGQTSNREQMDRIVNLGPDDVAALGELAPVKTVKERVWLRSMHRAAMKQRSAALGFRNLTHYITSLIRFDLLLGGPHTEFPGDKEISAAEALALDQKTLKTFEENKPRKCMVDYAVEKSAGREMTPEERDAALAKVSDKLCELAVKKHRAARREKK